MSFELSNSVPPVTIKTFDAGSGTLIFIGDYEIAMQDFVFLVKYVLTNTDLSENDKRRELVESIRRIGEVRGWNSIVPSATKTTRYKIMKTQPPVNILDFIPFARTTRAKALIWLANYMHYHFLYLTSKYGIVHFEKITIEDIERMYIECKDIDIAVHEAFKETAQSEKQEPVNEIEKLREQNKEMLESLVKIRSMIAVKDGRAIMRTSPEFVAESIDAIIKKQST